MSRVARSVFVYGIYVLGLAAALIIAPNIPLPIVGLPQANEVWIRVAGMTVLYLGVTYIVAALNEYRGVRNGPSRASVANRCERETAGHEDTERAGWVLPSATP